ncbi:DUF1513 domain-containing protein [Acidovorax sp. LjRoot118]|uniref:DUF1513 domain-containing protein n=1 Tax=Acidovorax sp. LjRoot118 TaxID=3342256 RepID=UPI003ECC2EBD
MNATLSRRQALWLMGGLAAMPLATHATPAAAAAMQLLAAWQQADGSYRIGLLAAQAGGPSPLRVRQALEVPTRAHGLAQLPDGSMVATARRPGDWLVRWHPGQPAGKAQWHWVDATRSFNGHAIASADGRYLYTTETDMDTGASLVARRDARSLETVDEWATQGIDAHELIWAPADKGARPSLIVANGGVPTAPETGRTKRDLHTMDSSIVRLHGDSGELQGQWRLPDARLSLRHLAWNAERTVLGIALQAEHGEAADKSAAPILALFDGKALRLCPAGQSMAGYGGSIASTAEGWAVSCPRSQGVATFTPDGQWRGLVGLEEVCALAVGSGRLWAAGVSHSLEDARSTHPLTHAHAKELTGARMDNHWVRFA